MSRPPLQQPKPDQFRIETIFIMKHSPPYEEAADKLKEKAIKAATAEITNQDDLALELGSIACAAELYLNPYNKDKLAEWLEIRETQLQRAGESEDKRL